MKCIYKNKYGEECGAHAMKDSEYCFFHDPSKKYEEARIEAGSKGGKGSSITVTSPLDPIGISTLKDVTILLGDTINQVRAGILPVKVANCIGVLSGHLIKALESSETVTKIETIERAILEKRTLS